MYPTEITFVAVAPGSAFTWEARADAPRFLVFRSARVDHDVETLLSGQHGPDVQAFAVPDCIALVDPERPPDAHYAVIAIDASGNLHAVEDLRAVSPGELIAVTALTRPHTHDSVYGAFPELVYRSDDPAGVMQMHRVASGLGARTT